MSREILTYLRPQPGQVFVDSTIGCGGHAEQILAAIKPNGRLIGIDQDLEALKIAEKYLKDYNGNLTLIHNNFENLDHILRDYRIEKVDGILFDLGLSSLQIESKTRGFSFQYNAPLDMRMNRTSRITAFDLINNLTEDEIARIIRNYGEERWARRIANLIVKERKRAPIVTTLQLANLVLKAVGYRYRSGSKIHPATRTFQAFRIAVNRELEALETGLEKAIDFLKSSARICVISFHSLEDRIVKRVFKKKAQQRKIKILTKKPLLPSEREILENPRSRSAKLRVAERNGDIR
jgi:16S rRNA (cytosine1402-N4)-methyltransferase